ncbi:MAG TPA: hypothetical protein VLT84_02750 [Acidobacteriota bacterium]|nr:hypothetical protein [Acidobacteriota bacterium]
MRNPRSAWTVALTLGSLAVVAMVPACGTDDDPAFKPAPHPAQSTPAGHYAVLWSDLDVAGSGTIVIPGAGAHALSPSELRLLGTEHFGTKTDAPTGWHLSRCTSSLDATGIRVSPHPHNVLNFSLRFDEGTGCAQEKIVAGACVAECAGLASLLGYYVLSWTGEPAPIVLNVTRLEVADFGYAFHWTPGADAFGSAETAEVDFQARGVTIEATFTTISGAGSIQVTFDRFLANAVGTSVTACPECPTPRQPMPREQISGG